MDLSLLLEQKKTAEEKALEKKLNEEGNFLKECDEFYKDFPIETAFAFLSAGASIVETEKVAKAWDEKQKYELKDPYYSCGWSPYNATENEKECLKDWVYKPLVLRSAEENMLWIERIMKRHGFCASKEADLMDDWKHETANYPKNEKARFDAHLQKKEALHKAIVRGMAWDLKDNEKKTEASKIAVPVKVFENLCKKLSQNMMMREAKPSV
jgi:hypothetical protein